MHFGNVYHVVLDFCQTNQMGENSWHVVCADSNSYIFQHIPLIVAACHVKGKKRKINNQDIQKKGTFDDYGLKLIVYEAFNICMAFSFCTNLSMKTTLMVASGGAKDKSKGKEDGYTTCSVRCSGTPLRDETRHVCKPATRDPKARTLHGGNN